MTWLPKKCVLVPIDFSEASLEAAVTARELVGDGGRLHVLHVLLPAPTVEPWALPDPVSRRKQLQETRHALQEQLTERGIGGAQLMVREGPAGLVIADYAEEIVAELIVIPSHGYSGLKRLLIGSVAERVIRHAPCPVLVLRRSD